MTRMTTDKMTNLTIKLTPDQVEKLKVFAAKACVSDWKSFATAEFEDKIIGAAIGTARINAAGIGGGTRISAPSTNNHYTHLNT